MNLKNGGVSFWYRDIGGLPKKFASLSSNVEADVCIIGGGYTGLWTAYYLKKIQPELKVIILEKEFCGFIFDVVMFPMPICTTTFLIFFD